MAGRDDRYVPCFAEVDQIVDHRLFAYPDLGGQVSDDHDRTFRSFDHGVYHFRLSDDHCLFRPGDFGDLPGFYDDHPSGLLAGYL